MTNHIVIPDDKELYFVSDFHFCHHKLCRGYEDSFNMPRNFETTEEMNEAIVKSMQLGPNAVVVFLGDFCMNVPGSEMRDTFYKFTDQFKVDKMLMIFGNHDHVLKKKLCDDNIEFYSYAVIEHRGKTYFCQHRDFNENPYFLKHEGAEFLNAIPENCLYLVHGHTHSPIFLSKVDKWTQNCVCFDVANRPIAADELVPCDMDINEDIDLAPELTQYYENIAEEYGTSLEQLIDDNIHHAMSHNEVLQEINYALNNLTE